MRGQRCVLEGTWSGYTPAQGRIVHREVCSLEKAQWANKLRSIHFGDGTKLVLRARRLNRDEEVVAMPGYTSLVEDCYRGHLSITVGPAA